MTHYETAATPLLNILEDFQVHSALRWHVEGLYEVTVMLWAILSVFFLCNTLLVWGVFMQRRDPFHLPRVMKMNWFRIATMIGGMGWLVAPVMCFSAFGIIGATAGTLTWLLSSALIALPIGGAAEGGISLVRG